MLWTDRVFLTTDDLARVDNDVVQTAEAESIVMDDSAYGFLRGSQEETANELSKMIISFGGYLSQGDISINHLSAVLNIGLGNSVRQKVLLQQICVSGVNAANANHIKQWAVHWALYHFFRACSGRTVKDRYEQKMRFYKSELVRRLNNNLYSLGIPVVTRPLSAPGATYERSSGTWDDSNVSSVAGPGTFAGNYYVAISYVDASSAINYVNYQKKNNSESATTKPITLAMTSGNVVSVDISSLSPPTGAQHPSTINLRVVSPLAATHWNVYVGTSVNKLHLQNSTPIPIDTLTYTLAGNATTQYPTSEEGQYEDRRLFVSPTRQRG
jgi:hypothetical protein